MKASLPASRSLSRHVFCRCACFLAILPLLLTNDFSQDSASGRLLSLAEKEAFLRDAKVVKSSTAKKGITGSMRATLSDGTFTNDASIQRIDFYRPIYSTPTGTYVSFRDSYKYNIAAYRLAVMLDLDNVPPSIERKFNGSASAYTWWIGDVLMDEEERLKRNVTPPDPEHWNQQMYVIRVFDQLIDNIDRNMGNLLITKDWRVWMIDHSRAFTPMTKLRKVTDLQKCDRHLLERLRALTPQNLNERIGGYLTKTEMKSLLARRDSLVRHFESLGETALYDLRRDLAAPPQAGSETLLPIR
jgi:hypothetical protein